MISIEAYRASIGRFYHRLRHFCHARNAFSITCEDVLMIFVFLLLLLLYLPILLHATSVLFVWVIFDSVYIKSVRYKYLDCLSHFHTLNYRGLNLNFLKLGQLLVDGDIESNPGPTQNDSKSPRGRPKKVKVFKGTAKRKAFHILNRMDRN